MKGVKDLKKKVIVYQMPEDCMVTVQEEGVRCIREAAAKKNLTTLRLSGKTGIDRNAIEGLYYGRHRIKLSYLKIICDTVWGNYSTYILQEDKTRDNPPKGE